MISITKKYIEYLCSDLNKTVAHFILIFNSSKKNTLLSHANLFLYSSTRRSKKTSSRYASIISMFYRYLSTTEEFKDRNPSEYHLFAENKDIRRWITSRETDRVSRSSKSPSTGTIVDDAKLLLGFFKWLGDNGFHTNVKIQMKTWVPPFKSSRYQQYVSYKAREIIDSTSIDVLDKENRQLQVRGLISPQEIEQLTAAYSDPVYPVLFMFALGTAMRPMDLCRYPYFGNGDNAHIMPFSSMVMEGATVEYTVNNSKGNKTRKIIIHEDALRDIENNYIKPYYTKRAAKYKENYGEKPPLSLLFLTEDGHPVTPDKISQRTNVAKKKALEKNPKLRPNLCFYDARDWWPTQYMIRCFGDDLLRSSEGLYNLAVAQVLQSQMGHSDVRTTFDNYMDMARVILSLHQSRKMEIFKSADFSATNFIDAIAGMPEEVTSEFA